MNLVSYFLRINPKIWSGWIFLFCSSTFDQFSLFCFLIGMQTLLANYRKVRATKNVNDFQFRMRILAIWFPSEAKNYLIMILPFFSNWVSFIKKVLKIVQETQRALMSSIFCNSKIKVFYENFFFSVYRVHWLFFSCSLNNYAFKYRNWSLKKHLECSYSVADLRGDGLWKNCKLRCIDYEVSSCAKNCFPLILRKKDIFH